MSPLEARVDQAADVASGAVVLIHMNGLSEGAAETCAVASVIGNHELTSSMSGVDALSGVGEGGAVDELSLHSSAAALGVESAAAEEFGITNTVSIVIVT